MGRRPVGDHNGTGDPRWLGLVALRWPGCAAACPVMSADEAAPSACPVEDRCKRVANGAECLACGGRGKAGGTGIAGAASYVPAGTKAVLCHACREPIDRPGVKPRARSVRGIGVVNSCSDRCDNIISLRFGPPAPPKPRQKAPSLAP